MADEKSRPGGEGAQETNRVVHDGRHQVPGSEPATQRAGGQDGRLPGPVSGTSRFGPGVPPAPAGEPGARSGDRAERVWREGRPVIGGRRAGGVRRLAAQGLTVIVLGACGVVLFLRFHHAAFQVTSVAITRQVKAGCGIDLTGQIVTNGSAGTVTYEWLFKPGTQPPQRLSQTVAAGQRAVNVTVVIDAAGNASQTVILRVLGARRESASANIRLSC